MLWSDFPPSHVLVSVSNYVQRLKKAFCDNELQKVEEIFLEFVIKLSFEKDNWTGEQLKTRVGAKFSTPRAAFFPWFLLFVWTAKPCF
jgi:deoxyhypusine synthase